MFDPGSFFFQNRIVPIASQIFIFGSNILGGSATEARHVLSKGLDFCKKNTVTVVAFFAALVTVFFVPLSRAYLDYFDWKTLACLFSVLAVVNALRNLKFFYQLAHFAVRHFSTMRRAALALVTVTFLGSMLIANDMALLTFLPLGYLVLKETGREDKMAPLFILQNIAANLGGMLTPFGNPQNLYLYGKFQIPTGAFLAAMAPSFAFSVCLIALSCVFCFGPEKLSIPKEKVVLPKGKTVLYLFLFALSIVMVFRVLPYYIGLAIIFFALLILDRSALKKVDYPLLFTFFFFFIFAGNLARIAPVRTFLSGLLQKDPLVVSALSCQVISNVPSAILLSQFTSSWKGLLIGVNIGGTGTLIASLASLITFREYTRHNPGKAGKYLALFSAFNFSFLILLILFNLILR